MNFKLLSLITLLALVVSALSFIVSYPQDQVEALSLETDNAAGSWERVWKVEGTVYALVGIDESTVMGVGSEGMIISSADGGVNWHYQAPFPDADLYDFSLNRPRFKGNLSITLASHDFCSSLMGLKYISRKSL